MAFEILLDLPDSSPRKDFKERLQTLCDDENEPQFTYSSERAPGRFEDETRSIKGMWADRIYTLRNHLIHGQDVDRREFIFQNEQHHILVGAVLFVCALKRTLNRARLAAGDKPRFYDTVEWTTCVDENDYPAEDHAGFVVRVNHFAEMATKKGMTPDEYLQTLCPDKDENESEDGTDST